jgi:hypothetical protein
VAGGTPEVGASSLFGDAPPIAGTPKRQTSETGESSEEENQSEESQDEDSGDENSEDNGSDGGGQDEDEGSSEPSYEPSSEVESIPQLGPRGGAAQVARGPSAPVNESVQAFFAAAASHPSLPFEVGRQLWSRQFSAVLQANLAGAASLVENSQLLALAGTVPTDAVRAELLKTLQRHWKEGPAVLQGASPLPELGIYDPGFLVLLKMLPRKPILRRPSGLRPQQPSKEDLVPLDWLRISYELVESYCRRFQAAGAPGRFKADPQSPMPIDLPPDAQPTSAYHADWRQMAAGRLGDVPLDPLVVHYVRIEETKELSQALGYYTRAVKYGTRRERKEQGIIWIDGLRDQRERKCSVDVIIRRLKPAPQRQPQEQMSRQGMRRMTAAVKLPEPLVIEILTVEINNPAPQTAASGAAQGRPGASGG